jgi:SAM-dependent methyltransferase
MMIGTTTPTPPDCRLCGARAAATPLEASSGRYWHCAACGLIFLDADGLPDAAAERAYYLTHDNRVDDPRYRAFLARLADPLCRLLAPGAAGLDFGCGPGPALAAMLAERGHPTAVYDPFFAPDPSPLDRHHDFVTCTEVVEHLHRPDETFALLASLLAPGGRLAVMTETHPGAHAFADWYYHRAPTHVAFYARPTFDRIAADFGWEIEFDDDRVVIFRDRRMS